MKTDCEESGAGRNITARLRSIVDGEIHKYIELLTQSILRKHLTDKKSMQGSWS
ncbi:MAG TPA: hypothetical protein HA262_05460 [Methanosarcina sp.]|nr:hypothetical protein [Methanosarcina sp.]